MIHSSSQPSGGTALFSQSPTCDGLSFSGFGLSVHDEWISHLELVGVEAAASRLMPPQTHTDLTTHQCVILPFVGMRDPFVAGADGEIEAPSAPLPNAPSGAARIFAL